MRTLFLLLDPQAAGLAKAAGLRQMQALPLETPRMRPPKADPYRNDPALARKASEPPRLR